MHLDQLSFKKYIVIGLVIIIIASLDELLGDYYLTYQFLVSMYLHILICINITTGNKNNQPAAD